MSVLVSDVKQINKILISPKKIIKITRSTGTKLRKKNMARQLQMLLRKNLTLENAHIRCL